MSSSVEGRPSIDMVLDRIRPEVRAERAYHVGSHADTEVKLNQNESPYDLPAELKQDLVSRFLDVPFNRYPTEQPDALARALADRDGHPSDGILVGNGSNELTYTLGLSLVSTGDPVVLPRPMFALYESMVRLHGGRVVGIAPRDDLSFDVDAVAKAVRAENPPLTVVTSPNNPTGLALSLDQIDHVVRASCGIVLVDEAYVEFNPYGSMQPRLQRSPNVIIMRTLSKAFGLAGLRLGYMMGHPRVIAEMMKARLPFMVDRLAQAAAHAILAQPDLVAQRVASMIDSTAHLTQTLSELPGVEVVPSMTNFVLFRTPLPPGDLLDRLATSRVLIRNMGGYPELAGFLRVSAGTPDENREFLTALKAALV
jgi:histidinol-phosphate aminotransferase